MQRKIHRVSRDKHVFAKHTINVLLLKVIYIVAFILFLLKINITSKGPTC